MKKLIAFSLLGILTIGVVSQEVKLRDFQQFAENVEVNKRDFQQFAENIEVEKRDFQQFA